MVVYSSRCLNDLDSIAILRSCSGSDICEWQCRGRLPTRSSSAVYQRGTKPICPNIKQEHILTPLLGYHPFPICFAAIVGRASVKYATWKLQKGTTIGALEQLMGSRTVASAFATQVQLRSANLIGIVLLLVWPPSPLGGQSSQ